MPGRGPGCLTPAAHGGCCRLRLPASQRRPIQWIGVHLAATQPTQKDFLSNLLSLKSVSAPSPLPSPIVEFLIARHRRDRLDLEGR
jgi:hypothetical protein